MPVVPSLKDLAIKTLQHYVDCIVDVGCLEPVSVRACLINAGRRTLVQIEDGTREASGRCIAWYTWHFWFRHFESTFGCSQQQIAATDLIPLPGSMPPDYVPPPGITAPTAHWRRMLERKEEAEKLRAESTSKRLRALYEKELELKESRKAEATTIRPPVKRRRLSEPQPVRTAAPGPQQGSNSKAKMLQSLGLRSKQPSKPGSSSGSSSSKQNYSKVTHTQRTVQAPPPPAPRLPSNTSVPNQSRPRPMARHAGTSAAAASVVAAAPQGARGGQPSAQVDRKRFEGTLPAPRPSGGSELSRAKEVVMARRAGGGGTEGGLIGTSSAARSQGVADQSQRQQQQQPMGLAQQHRMELARQRQVLQQQQQQQQQGRRQ